MRVRHYLAVCLIAVLAGPLNSHAARAQGATVASDQAATAQAGDRPDPANLTDQSRAPLSVADFLRLSYIIHTLPPVTKPGSPARLRVFFTDTKFFRPPITAAEIAGFTGTPTEANQDLLAMRCRPGDTALVALDPELPTWPAVAKNLLADLPAVPCPAPPGATTQAQAYCLAKGFQDTPNSPLIESLFNAISFGEAVAILPPDANTPPQSGENLLNSLYGISAGFSGLGFSVKDSANGAFTAQQSLVNSVVPEYLVRNLTLAAGNCRCVRVPPYRGRDKQPLSAGFIWSFGPLAQGGTCRVVRRIEQF